MNSFGQSGFVNSSEMNANFEFNSTPSTSKVGPTFSSNSSVTRPRMMKSRKSQNSKSMGSLGTRKIDPGFNPFRPVSDNVTGVNDDDDGVDDGLMSNSSSSKDVDFKVASNVEKVGSALIDEIRRLRVENQGVEVQSGNDGFGKGSVGVSGNQYLSKGLNSDLPSGLRQQQSRMSYRSDLPSGVRQQPPSMSHQSDLSSGLPDKMKMMNLGGFGGERLKDSAVGFDNVGGSHGVRNVNGSFGTSLASELPSDLERLKIKDTCGSGGGNFVFGGSNRNSFVFGSNRTTKDCNDSSIASTLPNRIKNLNIVDLDKNIGIKKEMNFNENGQRFNSGVLGRTQSGGVVDSMILDDIEKLKIGDVSKESSGHADMSDSSIHGKEHLGKLNKEESRVSYPTEFLNSAREQTEHPPQVAEHPLDKGSRFNDASSSFPPAVGHFQSVRYDFEVPYGDGAQKKEAFVFGCKQESIRIPDVEFKTPDTKGNLFTGPKLQTGFNSKKGLVKEVKSKGRKTMVKEPKPVLIPLVKNFTSKENNMQEEPSDSYSPMDVSPYRETGDGEHSSQELSLIFENQTSVYSEASVSNDAIDVDLIRATEQMDITQGDDVKHAEAEEKVSEHFDNACASMASFPVESESFISASENLDESGDIEVESHNEEQKCEQTQYFSVSSSASSGESSFTFAASSSSQGQASAAIRQSKKKNRVKAVPDVYVPARTSLLSDASSTVQFSPISRVSVLPSQVVQSNDVSTAPLKGGKKISSPPSIVGQGCNVAGAKKVTSSPTASARAAQEACEKWRLRGNQAYANGDLEKAEEYYSQGLSCIPHHETSRDCLRALVLCYSNRAAARMSRGRMREALQDCLVAAEIDPNFFRVQLRAANCYLALGEIGDASLYFKRLLQSTDSCVERKIILEASEGLQKAQEVYDFMNRSTELLLQRTLADAESALGVIAEAIVISPYSEKMLESKAEALFTLRRYEEVIQLCVQTLEAAEKNSPLLVADENASCLEASDLMKCYCFRIWRYSFIIKSNFYLGKLEDTVEFLEKQEGWRSMVAKFGRETLESLIPQLSTARELLSHKSAGNGAFQAGKHKDAVEHYTAALSFNVESRPFSAVCFANRAAAYQALGQITDAIADCSLAIALDMHYLKALSRRATLFEMIRDYEQAAKDLERLVALLSKQIEEKPNHSGAYLSMGSVSDLRQARQRFYLMEEQAKRGIPLNFYLILGVEPSVTSADLKKAYRKAALRHHPDKAGQSLARVDSGDDDLWKEIAEGVYMDADKLFKMIGEAYGVLSDPDKRSQYDIEEEMRNGQRKSSSNASRMHAENSFNATERSGSGRQWRDTWRSSAYPYSRGFEPTKPSRYY